MRRQQIDKYEGPVTRGIDVSKWQGEVDYDRVIQDAQLIRYVIVRTGDGKDIDGHAVRNLREAHKRGLHCAVYHYFRADRDGATQVALVREVLKLADVPILFVACDIEEGADDNLPDGLVPGPRTDELPASLVAAEALEFLEAVEQTLALPAVVYTGQWFHWVFSQARPELARAFGRFPLWVPSYGTKAPLMPVDDEGRGFPWARWTIWQYTAKGKVAGVSTPCDVNLFRGPEAALREAFVLEAQRPAELAVRRLLDMAHDFKHAPDVSAAILDTAARIEAGK